MLRFIECFAVVVLILREMFIYIKPRFLHSDPDRFIGLITDTNINFVLLFATKNVALEKIDPEGEKSTKFEANKFSEKKSPSFFLFLI